MKKQLAYVLVASLMGMAPPVFAEQPKTSSSSPWTLGASVTAGAVSDTAATSSSAAEFGISTSIETEVIAPELPTPPPAPAGPAPEIPSAAMETGGAASVAAQAAAAASAAIPSLPQLP